MPSLRANSTVEAGWSSSVRTVARERPISAASASDASALWLLSHKVPTPLGG